MNRNISIVFLIILVLFTGCHSFVNIDKDEYKEIKKNDVIIVRLQDGKCIENINVQNSVLTTDQYEIVDKDSVSSIFLLKDINEILVRKLNYPATLTLLSVPVLIFIGIKNLMDELPVGSTHQNIK